MPEIDPTEAEREAAKAISPAVLVLMGVSGSGKSTIARELQRVLGWKFQEGDDLHPPANIQKMRSGLALDDMDRQPWLRTVARWIDDRLTAGEPGIITCSNLKRAYRQVTVGTRSGVRLIYLKGDQHIIVKRIARRTHPYMPPALLRSQMETLEEPGADEHPIILPVCKSVLETLVDLLQRLAGPAQ